MMKNILLYLFVVLLIVYKAYSIKINKRSVDLSKEDLNFFFGDKEPPNYSYVNIRSRPRVKRSIDSKVTFDPGHLDVVLEDETAGRQIEFQLHPNLELLSPSFKVVVRGENGIIKEETKGQSLLQCVYIGSAKGKPDTYAALSSCDGLGFTGLLIDGEDEHLIRPLRNSTRRRKRDSQGMTPDGLHIIHSPKGGSKCGIHNLQAMMAPRNYITLEESDPYFDKDILQPMSIEEKQTIVELSQEEVELFNHEELSSLVHPHEEDKPHIIKKRASSKQYLIETAVFVDDDMYEIVKKREGKTGVKKAVENIVLAIMNGVYIMYNAPSLRTNINLVLVRLEIMEKKQSDLNKYKGEIAKYLKSFCSWQSKLNKKLNPKGDSDPNFWDHGILLSGLNLWDGSEENDAVIGLAWVAGMCNPSYSCTINEGTSFEAVYVITHEMGHNLQMSHDGSKDDGNNCPNNTYLMSPSTGPGKVTWSLCSNQELEEFLDTSSRRGGPTCLNDVRREEKGYDLSPTESLPGELYDSKDQCLYALGFKFAPYITTKHPYNNVCRELWCQNRTHALRTHPALEGSRCEDTTKYCISGVCVTQKLDVGGKDPSGKDPDPSNNEIPDSNSDKPNRRSRTYGLRDLLFNIRSMFNKYFLTQGTRDAVNLPNWELRSLTKCSVECGGGWQTGEIACIKEGKLVSNSFCLDLKTPSTKTSCNTLPCKKKEV